MIWGIKYIQQPQWHHAAATHTSRGYEAWLGGYPNSNPYIGPYVKEGQHALSYSNLNEAHRQAERINPKGYVSIQTWYYVVEEI